MRGRAAHGRLLQGLHRQDRAGRERGEAGVPLHLRSASLGEVCGGGALPVSSAGCDSAAQDQGHRHSPAVTVKHQQLHRHLIPGQSHSLTLSLTEGRQQ